MSYGMHAAVMPAKACASCYQESGKSSSKHQVIARRNYTTQQMALY